MSGTEGANAASGVAFVTGAGRGIGLSVAESLITRGYDIGLFGRNHEELDHAAIALRTLGDGQRNVVVMPGDVRIEAEVEAAKATTLAKIGVPSVVINNAGIVARSLVEDTLPYVWTDVIGVNLTGAFMVTRAFLPAMKAQKRGRFVAVASISSTLGTAKQSAYCASKWGLVGFMKSLAEELRGTGLQAMSVLPGTVDTEMAKGGAFPPVMSAAEVAKLIVYAALDAPAAMNGSSIEMFGP